MNRYNPNIHHRKSIRLQGYDYSKAGLYFITICCQDRACLFGDVVNGKMVMNKYGKIAQEEWQQTEQIRQNCGLHEFIIMPNHIHGIIEILFKREDSKKEMEEIGKFRSPSQTIGSIIRGFKIATIKRIKEEIIDNSSTGELQFAPTAITERILQLDFKIWQRNYYENIIRNEKSYQNISAYIINNPAKWDDDKFYK